VCGSESQLWSFRVDESANRVDSTAVMAGDVTCHITHDVTKTPDMHCGRSTTVKVHAHASPDTCIMIIIIFLFVGRR